MKYLYLITLFLCYSSAFAQNHTGHITGRVTSSGSPVVGANVGVEDLNIGSSTDVDGYFTIKNVPMGRHQLEISAVGFNTKTKTVEIQKGEREEIQIELESNTLELGQVVVTGTMKETFVKDSPVKVNVVSGQFLGRNPSNNLMEGISYINGLNEQVSCGVCGTSSIRINGMKGPYTAVLIDGMPIMGSLASVYGLDGINTSIIESIEIIKGPNSTLYGSEAMGGVINVRTKDPNAAPRFSADIYGSSHEEANVNLAFSPQTKGFSTMVSGNLFYFDRFLDHNDDNFADITKRKRLSLFNKWSVERTDARIFEIAAKAYYEDRFGGTQDFTKSLRGSDQVYGEAIETQRFEMVGSYQLPIKSEHIRADFSYSWHDQNSYYGDYYYKARQQVFFTNLIWDKRFSAARQLLVGGTFRLSDLNQTFDEIQLEDGSEDRRFTPGIFAQFEQIFSSKFKGLAGLRVDHHKDHGFIASPRMNLKADLSHHTTLRLNLGTGFRIVNLFTEEHEALSGSRQVVITENLDPERSYNGTINLNQIFDIGVSVLNVDLDLFYTHFTNQIIPNYQFANEIRYSNLDGYAETRGISLSAAHNFPGPLQYSIGVTLQDVTQTENGTRHPLPYAPRFNGVFSMNYTFEPLKLTFDYTGRMVGSMHLPEYDGYSDESAPYTEQNLKIGRQLTDGLEIYTSVKNLFNYTQNHPIVAPHKPFSEEFATDRVYGPVQTRRFLVGVSYKIK